MNKMKILTISYILIVIAVILVIISFILGGFDSFKIWF